MRVDGGASNALESLDLPRVAGKVAAQPYEINTLGVRGRERRRERVREIDR